MKTPHPLDLQAWLELHRKAIETAIAKARATPLSWEDAQKILVDDSSAPRPTLTLAERKAAGSRARTDFHESQHVILGNGYRISISFEHQPAGLLRHVSFSIPMKHVVPHKALVDMVKEATGMTRVVRAWIEEYEPHYWALNMVQIEK